MAEEGVKKLLNQSAFAKACGVSISTIRNRVDSGKIIPAQSIGGKDYFSEDQIISMQLAILRGSVTQSFLGLVFEDDDVLYESIKSDFVSNVQKICPSAHPIVSLAKSMEAMGIGAKFELTNATTPVYRGKVIDKFISSVRSMINTQISMVYLEEPLSRNFSYQFFLDVLCDDADSELVSKYESCGITNMKYLLTSICSSIMVQFNTLKGKYGVYNCCEKCGFTLKDALYSNGNELLDCEVPIVHDTNASGAKAVFDSIEKEAKGSLVKSGISAVYKDGFYTVIQVKSSISDKELADIISIITSGDYKSVFVSSKEKAPKLLLSVIDSRIASNYMKEM